MGTQVTISNGRPEDKRLTERAILLKKQFAEKQATTAANRANGQPQSTSR
jgi:hypothetical protein